ncbi:MAG: hypothetical protein P8J29_01345 [Rhodospirillales bacterium]|nr:hypothetical protein [Rhodospirillales bacterium]
MEEPDTVFVDRQKNISGPTTIRQMLMQAFEDANANGGNAPRMTNQNGYYR